MLWFQNIPRVLNMSGLYKVKDVKSHRFTERLTDHKIGKTFMTDQRKSCRRQEIELHKRMFHFLSTLFWLLFFPLYWNKRDFICHLKICNYFQIVFYGHTHLKNIYALINVSAKNFIAETAIKEYVFSGVWYQVKVKAWSC